MESSILVVEGRVTAERRKVAVVARKLSASGRWDAVVALGCVIRGDTPHFEDVAGECARGLNVVALETGVPVILGVHTT